MSERSLRKAEEKGLKIQQGSYKDVGGCHDLIISFAVIEHVPSPSDFLRHLKSHLTPKGILLTAQPCQDHGSYDIFFSDHLYHFFSHHITELGRSVGLIEIIRSTKNRHIRDFSLHVFGEESHRMNLSPDVSQEVATDVSQTILGWKKIFQDINNWLKRNIDQNLAIWGVGQTFTFLLSYTDLGNHHIEIAFDDNPERYAQSGFSYPVVQLESAQIPEDKNLTVLITFKPSRNVLNRLKERNIKYYIPFGNEEEALQGL